MTNPVYVPVIRNRQSEMAAVAAVSIPNSIALPMLEIVLNKTLSGGLQSVVNTTAFLGKQEVDRIIVDVPVYLNNYQLEIGQEAYRFRTEISNNYQKRIDVFKGLPSKDRIYAAVSLDHPANKLEYLAHGVRLLLEGFEMLAFVIEDDRTWQVQIDGAVETIMTFNAKIRDFVFILRKRGMHAPGDMRQHLSYIRSAIPDARVYIVHDNIEFGRPNNQYISGTDYNCTDLPIRFASEGFNGFGDYAGVSKEFSEGGGSGLVTAAIFYLHNKNTQIGQQRAFCTWTLTENSQPTNSDRIASALQLAHNWKNTEFSIIHKQICQGCMIIDSYASQLKPTNLAMLKRISIMHYLQFMIENFTPVAVPTTPGVTMDDADPFDLPGYDEHDEDRWNEDENEDMDS